MKTPEETKKGLEACRADECHGHHTGCPYDDDFFCIMHICGDALSYIEQMEKRASLNTMREAEIVTRCKDCVYSAPIEGYVSRKSEIGLNCMACRGDSRYGIVGLSFTVPDGYCDDGIRREGEAHD